MDDRYFWDWRTEPGVIGLTSNQGTLATCLAHSTVRAVQALYRISLGLELQLSIQHVINNVRFDSGGMSMVDVFRFMVFYGTCMDDTCRLAENENDRVCRHDIRVPYYNVFSFRRIAPTYLIDDVELRDHVRRQPIIGGIRMTWMFASYGINRQYPLLWDDGDIISPEFHAVLITGYGFDGHGRAYWIVQNPWGQDWGLEGAQPMLAFDFARPRRPPPKKVSIMNCPELREGRHRRNPKPGKHGVYGRLREEDLESDEYARQYALFHYDFYRTEGFGIEWDKFGFFFPYCRPYDGAPPLASDKTNEEVIKEDTLSAIAYYNEKNGANIQFLQHVEANFALHNFYENWITFWAVDKSSRYHEPRIYQAYTKRRGVMYAVPIFRVKPTEEEMAAAPIHVYPPSPICSDPAQPMLAFDFAGPGDDPVPGTPFIFKRVPHPRPRRPPPQKYLFCRPSPLPIWKD